MGPQAAILSAHWGQVSSWLLSLLLQSCPSVRVPSSLTLLTPHAPLGSCCTPHPIFPFLGQLRQSASNPSHFPRVGCLQMGDRLLSHSSGQGRPGLADSSSCCTWRCPCQPSLPVAPALWLRSSRCVRQQVWREQEECAEGAEPFALSGSGTQAGVGEGSQRRQPGPQRAPHQEAVWAGGRRP